MAISKFIYDGSILELHFNKLENGVVCYPYFSINNDIAFEVPMKHVEGSNYNEIYTKLKEIIPSFN